MSALDVLRSFAEARETDDAVIREGITYRTAREAMAEVERLHEALRLANIDNLQQTADATDLRAEVEHLTRALQTMREVYTKAIDRPEATAIEAVMHIENLIGNLRADLAAERSEVERLRKEADTLDARAVFWMNKTDTFIEANGRLRKALRACVEVMAVSYSLRTDGLGRQAYDLARAALEAEQ